MQGIFWEGNIEDNYIGHICAEVFKDAIYKPYLPNKKEETVALDIGGNVGIVSLYLSKYFERIISLEPSLEHFNTFTKMVDFNQIKNIRILQKALYIENTKLPLFHNRNKTMFSLHTGVDDRSSPPEKVETITFDKLFEDEKIEHVDLLKLDIEGTEVEVFSGEGFQKVAPKIDLIIGEQHSWSGRNPNQLREALKNNGFDFEVLPNDANIFVSRRN